MLLAMNEYNKCCFAKHAEKERNIIVVAVEKE